MDNFNSSDIVCNSSSVKRLGQICTLVKSDGLNDTVMSKSTIEPSEDSCSLNNSIVRLYIIVFVTVLGLTTNILTFSVLHLKLKQNSTNLLLKALTISYMFLLLSTFLLCQFTYLEEIPQYQQVLWIFQTHKILLVNWRVIHFISVWLVTATSFCRCYFIRNSVEASRFCTKMNICITIVLIIILAIGSEIPDMIFFKIRYCESHDPMCSSSKALDSNITNTDGLRLKIMLPNETFYKYIDLSQRTFFSGLLPASILLTCTVYMMTHLRITPVLQRRGSIELDPVHNLYEDGREGTRVILGITRMFLLSHAPHIAMGFVNLMMVKNTDDTTYGIGGNDLNLLYQMCWYNAASTVAHIAIAVNASVVFFIFVIFRKQFRQKLKEICSKTKDSETDSRSGVKYL